MSRVSQECEIVISNLSLLKTEDKEDGLIPNVWNYTLGSSFTDVPYEAHKCYVGKLKEHQEEIDYEINYGNEQDKLRSFIAIREEYKNNQSCKELPADLRFDSLGMESFTTNKIGAVIRKYYNQLTEPSANSPKKEGNLRG